LSPGDILVDLSINIDVTELWKACQDVGIQYINTATEEWEDSDAPISFPENTEEMLQCSLPYLHDQIKASELWKPHVGVTSVIEHGMNPGLISHFAKKGILDAAEYFLRNKNDKGWSDLDFNLIEKYLKEKNYPKLAQAMKLHTIHCSEIDTQYCKDKPIDTHLKFYNTWSCRGFFTEAMIPIQIAKGSHEDSSSEEFPRIRDNTIIMSWAPSYFYSAKSYVPFSNTEGLLIPHGESFSIREFFSDKETGYSPTHMFVYQCIDYAKDFLSNMKVDTSLQDLDVDFQVLDPIKYDLRGYDKVGSLLLFDNNRGWWAGTIMDEHDSSLLFNHKFGPTVIQVAAGTFSAFLWVCNNPNKGANFPEDLDTDFILNAAKPYLGRMYSSYIDLNKTCIKDCKKFEHFLTKKYEGKTKMK